MTDFVPFPKLARLSREIIITEKIDGTNASVTITDDGEMIAGSRTRFVYPGKDDNYGFAAWVAENKDELAKLGPGTHYGEWYGRGIQRTYRLTERRFALFNTSRWSDDAVRPACCHVVPVLLTSSFFNSNAIEAAMTDLGCNGSRAVPNFGNPEGIVVFHVASKALFKKTFEQDAEGKGVQAA